MNNGTKTEYSLPAFLRDLRRSDKVIDQILTQQEELGNPQLYAMETIISMMSSRENFYLQQLIEYKNKYGKLESHG